MNSRRLARGLAAAAGAGAVIAMGTFTAGCSKTGTEAPSSTTSTTTTSPESTAPVSPTEKSLNPSGGNLFTPSVKAPPAPTVPGGQHPGLNGTN